ncbi:hypothetical protein [Brumicola pallidula]|uniref:Polysaccharide biosynthesis protein n=1 Tax=Brumicola pallidula DSM 14239 = ACAM 615 TaxID=1121922 RepID=K6ZHP9_9ALTE|nr:hypothetical protein [Glaciecola pallidula]GAC29867.1 hypothetical protein GPAL_3016 [Glaciecola pallidula DSM 14239 = ACAM 615]
MLKKTILSNGLYSILTGGIKLIGGLILLKLAVNQFGRENLIYLGQFNSIFFITSSIASAGLYAGIISLNREMNKDIVFHSAFIHASKLIAFGLILLVILWVTLLNENSVFDMSLFFIASFLLVLFPLGEILLGFINANNPPSATYITRSLASVIAIAFGYFVLVVLENGSFLINTLYGLSLSLGTFIFLFSKKQLFTFNKAVFKVSVPERFYPYAKIFIISIIFLPTAKIFTREYILSQSSNFTASLWQSYLTISDAYTVIFSVFLTSFYIKYISGQKEVPIYSILRNILPVLLPLLGMSFAFVFFIWPDVSLFLLNFNIDVDGDYRIFFVVADAMRFVSLLITYNFIVREKAKVALVFEVVQSVSYVAFISVGAHYWGVLGAAHGYAYCYFIYLLLGLGYVLKDKINNKYILKS